MTQCIRLRDGRIAGLSVCEVTAIPYFELLNKEADRACHLNQVLFSQILAGFYRRAAANNSAIEILWQSFAVADQTYAAQVRQYVLLRHIGSSEAEVTELLDAQMRDLSAEWNF